MYPSSSILAVKFQFYIQDNVKFMIFHVTASKEFRQDLTLSNSAWIYTNDESMRRCLVVQYKAPKKKEDSKQEDIDKAKIKKMRDLGVKAAGQFQAKKASEVDHSPRMALQE